MSRQPPRQRPRISRIARGILLLVSGTLGAQFITFASLLILARLYTAEAFGYFSLIMAIVGVITPIAALRYETAAMLPEALPETQSVVRLAVSSTLAITAGAFGFLQIATRFDWFGLAQYPLLSIWVSILVPLVMAYTIMSQLALRKQQYALIAKRSLLRAGVTGAAQIGLAFVMGSPSGLLTGVAFGSVSGFTVLWKQTKEFFGSPPAPIVRAVAGRYWRFPAVFTPSTLVNVLGMQLPLLFVTATFGLTIGGQLGMAERIITVPIMLLGGAVGQAIDAEVGQQVRDARGILFPLFKRFSLVLGLFGLATILGGTLLGAVLIPFVLGSEWSLAGAFVQILALTSGVRLVANPISKYIDLLERSIANVILDVLRMSLMVLAIWGCIVFNLGLEATLWAIYTALTITYLATWAYVLQTVRRHDRTIRSTVAR